MQAIKYCYGIHTVRHVLEQNDSTVSCLYVLSQKKKRHVVQALMDLARAKQIQLQQVEGRVLQDLVGDVVHQGVVVQLRDVDPTYVQDERGLHHWLMKHTGDPLLLLILDGVQSPHNLGACLRSAAAFSCDAVIIPKRRTVGLTSAVEKAACGASRLLPLFQVSNLARTLSVLQQQNVWLYGADERAEQTLDQTDLRSERMAFVLGSEQTGLRRLTRCHCDFRIGIPTSVSMPTLNISVAASVLLFEACRQNSLKRV